MQTNTFCISLNFLDLLCVFVLAEETISNIMDEKLDIEGECLFMCQCYLDSESVPFLCKNIYLKTFKMIL